MIRARFHAYEKDYRPVKWPIKHPYWCSGYGDGYSIIIAFAENEAEILENWPEATEIDSEEVDEIKFTGRFPKPAWYEEESRNG